jgi:hypothetical protein
MSSKRYTEAEVYRCDAAYLDVCFWTDPAPQEGVPLESPNLFLSHMFV